MKAQAERSFVAAVLKSVSQVPVAGDSSEACSEFSPSKSLLLSGPVYGCLLMPPAFRIS